jgi:hypothetical protein
MQEARDLPAMAARSAIFFDRRFMCKQNGRHVRSSGRTVCERKKAPGTRAGGSASRE